MPTPPRGARGVCLPNALARTASHGDNPAGATQLLLLALIALTAGCAVPVHRHRFLARPAMQYQDHPAYRLGATILSQTEPGVAASGGALAAGCASCR